MKGHLKFDVVAGPIQEIKLLHRKDFTDMRGSFSRLYSREDLLRCGIDAPIADINYAVVAKRGTVKGLHFQRAPFAETKIVTCLSGKIFDVAVDLRMESPTRGSWFGVEMSGGSPLSVLIPPGFAHGVQSLQDNATILYMHTAPFTPDSESGVNPLDEALSIAWPLTPVNISDRDRTLPPLSTE